MAPKKYLQVGIELQHKATLKASPDPITHCTHDWSVCVRGVKGNKIEHFVEKVIFNLHESFENPRRVVTHPPYEIKESGYASFKFPIDIHFRNTTKPFNVIYEYDLILLLDKHHHAVTEEQITFLNPTEEFERKVLRGGGYPVAADQVKKQENGEKTGKQRGEATAASSGKEKSFRSLGTANSSPASSTHSSHSATSGSKQQTGTTSSGKQMRKSYTSSAASQAAALASGGPGQSGGGKKRHVSSASSTSSTASAAWGAESVGKKRNKLSPSSTSSTSPRVQAESGKLGAAKGTAAADKKKGKQIREHSVSPKQSAKKSTSKTVLENDRLCKIKQEPKEREEVDAKKTKKIQKRKKAANRSSSSDSSSSHHLSEEEERPTSLLGHLMAEMSDDDDDDTDENVPKTPFKNFKKEPFTKKESVQEKSETSKKHSKSKNKKSEKTPNGKSLSKTSEKHNKKPLKSPDDVKKEEVVVKVEEGCKKVGSELPAQPDFAELVKLQRRLSECRDRDRLQNIVDVIVTASDYTITDKTFDFDLCKLDTKTVRKIESYMQD